MGAPGARSRLVVAPKNLRGFRGLTFDGYGALLQGGPSEMPRVLTRVATEHGRRPNRADAEAWRKALRDQYDADPFVAFREAHRNVFREMFTRFGIPGDVDPYVDEALEEYRGAKAWPEAAAVLHEIEREVAMAVISNMDTMVLLQALHANGLSFTFILTSEEEQRYKPSAPIFQRAIRYLGLPAGNILHVGDSYVEDIVGATSVGMDAVLIQRGTSSPESKRSGGTVIHDLRELPALVQRSRE